MQDAPNGDIWASLYAYFMQGEPPIINQLLLLNTFIMLLFILRRSRGARAMSPGITNCIQIMLVVANCTVLLNGF